MNDREKKQALKRLHKLESKLDKARDDRDFYQRKTDALYIFINGLNNEADQILLDAKHSMTTEEYHEWITS